MERRGRGRVPRQRQQGAFQLIWSGLMALLVGRVTQAVNVEVRLKDQAFYLVLHMICLPNLAWSESVFGLLSGPFIILLRHICC